MADSPVKQLLKAETEKHALIGHLPREVGVMYREALAEIERLEYEASYCEAAQEKQHRFVSVHGLSVCSCCGRPEQLPPRRGLTGTGDKG